MNTVSDLFDSFGGPTAVARVLRVGASTASEMKRRGSVPPEYWTQLVVEAANRGLAAITYESLALAHARAKGRDVPSDQQAVA